MIIPIVREQKAEATLILVSWLDSVGDEGWEPFDTEHQSMECHSVGWLISEAADRLVIAPHFHIGRQGTPNGMRGSLTIPRRCVTEVKKLEVVA